MNLDKIQILGAGPEGHRLVEICKKEGIEVVAIGDIGVIETVLYAVPK